MSDLRLGLGQSPQHRVGAELVGEGGQCPVARQARGQSRKPVELDRESAAATSSLVRKWL